MKLATRLVAGALVVIAVFTALLIFTLDRRLRGRLTENTTAVLLREARLVASQWRQGIAPDVLADAAGATLGVRVTLIDSSGRVVGDSDFDEPALAQLENHAARPEVAQARLSGSGSARRPSPSAGDVELYAAVRAPLGVARTSISTAALERLLSAQLRDILPVAIAVALITALLITLAARALVRPVVALRDETRAIAAGDLSRRPALDAAGEIGDLARAVHSMREQLAARLAALERDEALFTAVSTSLNEGLVALDARGNVVHMNAQARTLLGVSGALTPPFSTDALPRDRPFRDALAAAQAGAEIDGLDLALDERTIALTARGLAGGGAVLALLDLTRIRRLENVRRDFVANVSHELKTPLTVIGGFAETLMDDALGVEQRRAFAGTIASNARRMQRLVDDLLDLSRIESGGWRPSPAHIDLPALAGEVFATLGSKAKEAGVALASDIPSGAGVAYADATALRQILCNLVENGVRHAPNGRVIILARRRQHGLDISVRDSGSGIAPEHLPRIFERFYRADAARSRLDGGTGLGLAIVKHLAEAHGGHVAAHSALGAGTTVTVWLPGDNA
ncbi:MAG: ATP-binding protein [Gemmatimonadaceae bacterium]